MQVYSRHCNIGKANVFSEPTMTDNKSKTSTATNKNAAAKNSPAKKKDTPATETSTNADQSPSVDPTKKSRRSRRRTHGRGYTNIILFALFISVIIALVYWVEKQQKELASHNRYQIDQLNNSLTPMLDQLVSSNADLQQRVGDTEAHQQALSEAFSNMLKTRRHLRNDWLLAEADYLLRLANHRLLLARDIGSALAAMQTADERLHDMANPAVIPVRKLLAEDINQLKAVQAPDIAGLSARLSALAHSVDSLSLLAEYVNTANTSNEETKPAQVDDWKQLPEAIWGDMKKLLVIRERHGKVIPLLSPEQHFFLQQNLKLKLEQAQLALLNAEQTIYQQRLQTASTWVHDFFKPEDPASKAMLSEIEQLGKENIKPTLPDISASYRALQDFREQTDSNGDAS